MLSFDISANWILSFSYDKVIFAFNRNALKDVMEIKTHHEGICITLQNFSKKENTFIASYHIFHPVHLCEEQVVFYNIESKTGEQFFSLSELPSLSMSLLVPSFNSNISFSTSVFCSQ